MKDGMKIKCSKCNYQWVTKSKLKKVTCPSCSLKINKIEKEVKK